MRVLVVVPVNVTFTASGICFLSKVCISLHTFGIVNKFSLKDEVAKQFVRRFLAQRLTLYKIEMFINCYDEFLSTAESPSYPSCLK